MNRSPNKVMGDRNVKQSNLPRASSSLDHFVTDNKSRRVLFIPT